jgi:hypothetical protein
MEIIRSSISSIRRRLLLPLLSRFAIRVSFREIIDVFRVANNIVFAAHKGKGKATKTLKTKPKKILLVCLLFNDDTIVTLYDDVCFLIISLFTLYSLSLSK